MGIWQDIRFAARLIAKEPWFTSVVVLVLAFGLGVNTAVFTIVNATLLRGLPFDEPEKIISLSAVDSRGRNQSTSDRKSTRLNSSHLGISYAVFCLKKKK